MRKIRVRSFDMRRAPDNNGSNFFDNAIAYQSGMNKQYIGKALRDMTRRRDVVVAAQSVCRTSCTFLASPVDGGIVVCTLVAAENADRKSLRRLFVHGFHPEADAVEEQQRFAFEIRESAVHLDTALFACA